MAIDCKQLRDQIVIPVLTALGLHSYDAVRLLLGTAAQESSMGLFIVQKKIGLRGGLGIYQMEDQAYISIWQKQILPNVALRAKFRLLMGYEVMPRPERMISDLYLATAMARLYYYAINKPLPVTVEGLAKYWKQYYNTEKGDGTEAEFLANYKKYVIE